MLSKKNSLLIPSQLPAFIREDPNYSNFVLFLQAYYEWMEEQGGALYESKNIPNYYDVDKTLDSFLTYFRTEFLSLFPEETIVDQRKLIKYSKQIFGSKGTPSSFRFLFRVLFGSDVEVFNTKDFVFKASDGKWLVTKTIQLATTDVSWLNTKKYKIFGEKSFGYAIIEQVIQNSETTTLVLSGVFRTFMSGEYIKVVDSLNKDVLFNGSTLRARIIGTVKSVEVDSFNVGLSYRIGDPVLFIGGLDPNVANPIGANAFVSSVTTSSVKSLSTKFAGSGYTIGNTEIIVSSTSGGVGAAIDFSSVDANNYYVSWVTTDRIQDPNYPNRENIKLNSTFTFPNIGITNANIALSQVLTSRNLITHGIGTFIVGSGGYNYFPESTSFDIIGKYGVTAGVKKDFASLGILSPIVIRNRGLNYAVNDQINITGGSGYGAWANVSSVDGSGRILTISYVRNVVGNTAILPLGGIGYRLDGLPSLSISSVSGSGADIYIPGIVGDDATVDALFTPEGEVLSVSLEYEGRDYISTPNVSFRVLDLLAYNNNPNNSVQEGDVLIQTSTGSPSGTVLFYANVNSAKLYTSNSDPYNSTYTIRLYNYSTDNINNSSNLIVLRDGELIGSNLKVNTANIGTYTLGKIIYGNGLAKGQAKLSQGVILGEGVFLNSDGHPSGSSILQDKDYNEFTYFLKVEKALEEYKETVLKFLHPSGFHYKSFNTLNDEVNFNSGSSSQTLSYVPLSSLLGIFTFSANIANSNFANTIIFTGLSGTNIAQVVLPNSFITFYTTYGQPFTSKVVGSNSNNTLILADSWITSVPNVAYGQASGGTNTINILWTTNSWSIATGNTFNYLSDFINLNDRITFNVYTSNVTQITQQSKFPSINLYNTTIQQSNGYITLTRNVVTSNIWVAGNVAPAELIQITTESGDVLATESLDALILG